MKGQVSRDRLCSKVRVATEYSKITERYFNQRGVSVEIVKLYGSIELAPLVGLADRIVDLVETGNTLKADGLVEVECIAQSTARLIVESSKSEAEACSGHRADQKASGRESRPSTGSRTSAQVLAQGTSNG